MNRLRISQGHDGLFRVRSPEKPYPVLKIKNTELAAYLWAHRNRTYAKKEPPWVEWEFEYLMDNYGQLPAEEIARHLRRSTNSLKIMCSRKLKINQKSNIYTSRLLAQELGVACSKTIVAWYNRGYLKGKLAPFMNGPNHVWWFDYEDIIECLQQRPWLCDLKKMPTNYFQSIVQREWEKNPWYSKEEAGHFLGLADGNPVYRYIKQGWLPAIRAPMGGGKGRWILRHSDLAYFQLHDPRPEHRKAVSLPATIEHELEAAERKAWAQLARGRFQLFGYWASVYNLLASKISRKHPNPFNALVEIAKEVKNAQTEKRRALSFRE